VRLDKSACGSGANSLYWRWEVLDGRWSVPAQFRMLMADFVGGVAQPKQITGRLLAGSAVIEFCGPDLELLLTGLTAEQLESLQAVAALLERQLREKGGHSHKEGP